MINKLSKVIDGFKNKKIGVIGDLMLDQFIWGDAERISPEAPVPVVLVSKETSMPGGAANIANNVAEMGGKPYMIGVVGSDLNGSFLTTKLKGSGIDVSGVLTLDDRPTISKTRIIAGRQHVVRVDREKINLISGEEEAQIIKNIEKNIHKWDLIIISDYAKGLLTDNLIKKVIVLAKNNNKTIVGNSKKPTSTSYLNFENIDIFTANLKEAKLMTNTESLEKSGNIISKRLKCNTLITKGPEGMSLFKKGKMINFPVKAKEVFDVSGAGDTVVAALGLSLASGLKLEEAVIIANHAAGVVVGKLGTATVLPVELKNSLKEDE